MRYDCYTFAVYNNPAWYYNNPAWYYNNPAVHLLATDNKVYDRHFNRYSSSQRGLQSIFLRLALLDNPDQQL